MKIIEAVDVSKSYRIRLGPSATTVRDLITLRLARGRTHTRRINALDSVSFSVDEGEVLGIVGNNGAGKSTLLKILSRIILPTSGEVVLRGRTGSLLEVGTGFHRELSGRENIYLNGAILGMKRSEIQERFDEIVAFAEVDEFLDTPIKHYSSGMFTRLAFSVAAHLEPEILIIDEVLAVGDLAFQRKCLRKMQDVNRHGRTILFVSHNMQAISRICRRAILLNDGKIVADGAADDVVASYLSTMLQTTNQKTWADTLSAPGDDTVRLRSVRVRNETGEVSSAFDIRRPILIELGYEVLKDCGPFSAGLELYNEEGICLFVSNDLSGEWRRVPRKAGRYISTALIPENFLAEGNFFVSATATTFEPLQIHFHERDTAGFSVSDSLEGDSARGDLAGHMHGVVRPILEWVTQMRD
ncbi:MAG: ABC transporter ATP-binding protein [Aridibacter famidurans]|nr:ABC transporter ATP-binding protein [Aridibacter famidurans]